MSDEDGDWFERALRALDAEAEADSERDSDSGGDADHHSPTGDAVGESNEETVSTDAEGRPGRPPATDDVEVDSTPNSEADASDGRSDAENGRSDAENVRSGAVENRSGAGNGRDDGDTDWSIAGDDGAEPFPPGTSGADRSGFGPGGVTEPGSDVKEPFGGGDDGDFGFANFEESSDEPSMFGEDADFDSAIDRIDIGIDGLDEMILGGVPDRSLISVIGSAGTGKTTFALQFLNESLEAGEKAIYITLEQSRRAMIDTATEKGWAFDEYVDDGRLAIVAIDPVEMANSLASIRNDLARLITDFGAERLVLDSVSLLEMMYDHPAKRRSEVFDFTRALKESGVTTLLTSEADQELPYASRHGIVEYLTDAVIILQYVRPSDFQETRLAIEILKIRDANHSRETKPYEITNTGISVHRQANIF